MFLITRSLADFNEKAAQIFEEAAQNAIRERGFFCAALSGGATPRGVYARLSKNPFRTQIDWSRVFLFFGDERWVPPRHPESNFRMVRENLFSKVKIPRKNIFPIPTDLKSPSRAARAYEKTLRLYFKNNSGKALFDLCLLGVGGDGHTASLFPGTWALREKRRWVAENHIPALNSYRITCTYPIINRSKRILVLCAGAEKAVVIQRIFKNRNKRKKFPIERVVPKSGNLIWLIDQAAAGMLPKNSRRLKK